MLWLTLNASGYRKSQRVLGFLRGCVVLLSYRPLERSQTTLPVVIVKVATPSLAIANSNAQRVGGSFRVFGVGSFERIGLGGRPYLDAFRGRSGRERVPIRERRLGTEADGEGFEPPDQLPSRRFSKPVP